MLRQLGVLPRLLVRRDVPGVGIVDVSFAFAPIIQRVDAPRQRVEVAAASSGVMVNDMARGDALLEVDVSCVMMTDLSPA
jgi:hypothetical protein